MKFAECIREHGVPDFPDPDAKGDFVFGIDVSPAVWKKAVDACKDLQPPGALSGKRSPSSSRRPSGSPSACATTASRTSRTPPTASPSSTRHEIPSSNRPGGMTILNAAMQKCGAVLGLAAGGQG